MALMANSYHTSSDIPFWVQLSCAIAMGLGTSVGGWKIIKTVGGQIMKIRPVNGVAADLSSSLVIFGATFIHLPVSTTHVISSSILGVGASHRVKGVKWGTAKRMLITWVITLPISASLAALFYSLLHLILLKVVFLIFLGRRLFRTKLFPMKSVYNNWWISYIEELAILEYIMLLFIGLIAGTVGSLVGLGGGIIIVPLLIGLHSLSPQLAVGTSMVTVVLQDYLPPLLI